MKMHEDAKRCMNMQISRCAHDYWTGLDVARKRMVMECDHLQEPHQLFVETRVAYMECMRHCYGNSFYLPTIK